MTLIKQLEEKAAKYGLTVDYDGAEVVIVCAEGFCFDDNSPTEIYSPWDAQPVVACLRQALRDIDELGETITKTEED
jgi:hypothetical protein